jgi:hypothetical protein
LAPIQMTLLKILAPCRSLSRSASTSSFAQSIFHHSSFTPVSSFFADPFLLATRNRGC